MNINTKTLATFLFLLFSVNLKSQTLHTNTNEVIDNRVIEIRSYNLKPGTRDQFNELFLEQALPLLKKWNIEVVTFGPSIHDSDSYFLVRSYKDLQDMQQREDAFYGSNDWRKGPREPILALIENFTTIVLPEDSTDNLLNKILGMEAAALQKKDSQKLSELNAQFIKNFVNEDVQSHNQIIHNNFVCIGGDGSIVDRDTYMKNWASDYARSGYTSFSYGEEQIRIFGNIALVRSKTTYTKKVNGKNITGHSIYTDTYIKENGKWSCVQAHITPVKNK